MTYRLITLAISALILTGGLAVAQQTTPEPAPEQSEKMIDQGRGQGMMGQRMGRGMRGHRMQELHHRIMLILIDTDGDGALSLEEVQTAHARIFKAVDANQDGKVTLEEMQMFFRGGRQARSDDEDDEQ